MPTSKRRRDGALVWWLGLATIVVATVTIVPTVDGGALRRAAGALLADPGRAALMLAAYAAAFALRAWAWRRVLPRLPYGHALAAIHVSLAGNHLLPARLGEVLRVVSVVRRAGVDVAAATASTVTLRAADIVAVAVLAVGAGAGVAGREATAGGASLAAGVGAWGWVVAAAAVAGLVVGWRWLGRLSRGGAAVRRPDPAAFAATLLAWLAEAAVIATVAAAAGVPLSPLEAVVVTAVTIAAQVAALAPGGFGTYEAAATAALVLLGVDTGTALAVALVAHAVKTLYALVAGAVGALVPAPSLWGRLRLARTPPVRAPIAAADGPVVLFLPAHDEEASVGDVVARAPRRVDMRAVEVIVIDDGSTDATAARAREAGAEVVAMGENRGLGAAVRRGLREGVGRGAAAVAFCDADGEYDPRELERMVQPVLDGRADYVVGSRFGGTVERMLVHRRLGNRLLTVLLRFVARRRVTDGQSGYRALSAAAAAEAELVHDYNYAQVLTLDLLGKGFRYLEVPISYRFRTCGRSFVRLGAYLQAVLPAMWRELNAPPGGGGGDARPAAEPANETRLTGSGDAGRLQPARRPAARPGRT